MRIWKGIVVPLIIGSAFGCHSYPLRGINTAKVDFDKVPQLVQLPVVHISQNDDYSCATTSLAMAISYYEKLANPIDKNSAWVISRTNRQKIKTSGNDMDGLKRLANHFGYKAEYADRLSIPILEYLLSNNILAVLNITANKTGNATHAILATGYDNSQKKLLVNDPADRLTEISFADLEERWSAFLSVPYGMSYKSAFIIYPKQVN